MSKGWYRGKGPVKALVVDKSNILVGFDTPEYILPRETKEGWKSGKDIRKKSLYVHEGYLLFVVR